MRVWRLRRSIERHIAAFEHACELLERLRSARSLAIVDHVGVVPFVQLEQSRHVRKNVRALFGWCCEHTLPRDGGQVSTQFKSPYARGITQLDFVQCVLISLRQNNRLSAKNEFRRVLGKLLERFLILPRSFFNGGNETGFVIRVVREVILVRLTARELLRRSSVVQSTRERMNVGIW